jgi:hypothetical protein
MRVKRYEAGGVARTDSGPPAKPEKKFATLEEALAKLREDSRNAHRDAQANPTAGRTKEQALATAVDPDDEASRHASEPEGWGAALNGTASAAEKAAAERQREYSRDLWKQKGK